MPIGAATPDAGRRRLRSVSRQRLWLFGICLALATALAATYGLSVLQDVTLRRSVAWVEHTHEVIAAIEAILVDAQDVETGQRGFLVTGEVSYLERYRRGLASMQAHLAKAQELTRDNAHQQARLQVLEALLRARALDAARVIELAQDGDFEQAAGVMKTGQGKRLMDLVRQTVAAAEQEEDALLRTRREAWEAAQVRWRYLLVGVLLLATASVVAGGIAARATNRQAAAAAAERQRLLDRMNLAAIMVRDFDGTILDWSRGCESLYGWTAAQAIGQLSQTLLRTVFPIPLAEIEAVLLREGTWTGELRQCTRDGRAVIVAAHKVLVREADGQRMIMENATDITQLRQAESALQASQAELRDNEARLRLVQAVGGTAYTDHDLRTTEALVSEDYARLYGLPPGQAAISTAAWLALLAEEDRDRVRQQVAQLYEHGGGLEAEYRVRRSDGGTRWIAMRAEAFPGPDGRPARIVTAQRDITDDVIVREALERGVAERTAALGEAEARFRAIFDSQIEMIGLLDADGTVLEVNAVACGIAGLTPEQSRGRRFWDGVVWPDGDPERLRQELVLTAGGSLVRREAKLACADGSCMWVDYSLTPVRDAATGAVKWIIPEGRDITPQRTLAEQLAQAQKVQALGQLAGGIAHDFNNILQAVEGAATLIERRPDDIARTLRLSRTMIEAVARGASITRRLLSYGRKGELHFEALATADLLQNVREVLAHTLGATIRVQTVAPADLPAMVADRSQLETALINLGTNARDAMPTGGVLTLSAAAEFVAAGQPHPAGLGPGGYVKLVVTDTGTGMDQKVLAQAADAFFTTKPTGQGTGLGLPMVKGFVEQCGGALNIASVPGQGTSVTLWLPQAASEPAPRADAQAPARDALHTQPRVLLVDDDDLVRETLAAQLEDLGLEVLVASSGTEAIALLARERVDVLATDLSMPGINGVTTIEQARALHPGLTCFLLTGYVGERAALAADDTFTLVRKPLSADRLLAQIEARLEADRRQRA